MSSIEASASLGLLKTCVILNPHSGRVARLRSAVEGFASAQGWRILPTTHPLHARELATEALQSGFGRVVAVGGDGTMNEVAGALVGSEAVLGLVPCGSGNGLGRHLGIHGPLPHMLGILTGGRPRRIDTGTADGHAFFCVAGLGFEAGIAARFNSLRKRGFLRYLSTGLRTLRGSRAFPVTVETDGGITRFEAFTLAVANSDQYGNNARIAPGASVTDGRLDLTALPAPGILTTWPLLWQLFRGSLRAGGGVHRLQAARFLVRTPGPGTLHTDGETHSVGAAVEFVVRPASLQVLCPDVRLAAR